MGIPHEWDGGPLQDTLHTQSHTDSHLWQFRVANPPTGLFLEEIHANTRKTYIIKVYLGWIGWGGLFCRFWCLHKISPIDFSYNAIDVLTA